MKVANAKSLYLLLHDNGEIHYPFSHFLTHEFDNPNTRELVAQSLRVFERFLSAHSIELATRALEGLCLTYDEVKSLAGLCFRPLTEIEGTSDGKVVSITSAKSGEAPMNLPEAMDPNTALKRLNHISSFLKHYREVFLDPHIRPASLRTQLEERYERTREQLNGEIGGTKQNHHLMIKSLPSHVFLKLIRAVVVEPEHLFISESGKVSPTIYRDRAMVLLACEGMRPGSIGNVAIEDFRASGGYLVVKDNRHKRLGRPSTSTPLLKMGASTSVNNASEAMITLWPFTVKAIQDYLQHERETVLAASLNNKSRGFMFISERGGSPINNRATLTALFRRFGDRLSRLGMLDVGNDPHFFNSKEYDFYGYVLRHSAASLFVEFNGTKDQTLDAMRLRFGWTLRSTMPQKYASRALSDTADIDLMNFYESMVDELRKAGKA